MTRFDLEPSTSATATTRSADAGPASYVRRLPEEVDSLATCRPVVAVPAPDEGATVVGKGGRRQRTVHRVVTLAQTIVTIGKLFRRQRGHQV